MTATAPGRKEHLTVMMIAHTCEIAKIVFAWRCGPTDVPPLPRSAASSRTKAGLDRGPKGSDLQRISAVAPLSEKRSSQT